MTLTANVTITSTGTQHRAWNSADGPGDLWHVSWCPEQWLTHNQAITAMSLAELVGTGFSSPVGAITSIPEWAAELGLPASEAVARITDRRSWGYAVRYATLPWQHKSILLLLGTYFTATGTYRRPAVEDLVHVTGLVEQHLVDLLVELETAGWFSWHAVTGTDINAVQPDRPPAPDLLASVDAKANGDGDTI